jgi:hypothetical protein
MGLTRALRALAEHWDDIVRRLDQLDAAELQVRVGDLTTASIPAMSVEKAMDLTDFLATRLPRDHPFREALAANELRFATPMQHEPERLATFLNLADTLRGRVTPDDVPSAERVMRMASLWLLEADSFGVETVRGFGRDPLDADLIRLPREDGTEQWPAFQFDQRGAVPDIVRAINKMLRANEDPWGVADWWLGDNAWLDAVPARLVGRTDDDRLINAAARELAEA